MKAPKQVTWFLIGGMGASGVENDTRVPSSDSGWLLASL